MRISTAIFVLILSIHHLFAESVSNEEINIYAKYNGYNIVLVNDSNKIECSKLEAKILDVNINDKIKLTKSNEYQLSVKCFNNDDLFGYVLIRTIKSTDNPRFDRYYFYSKEDYDRVKMNESMKKNNFAITLISALIAFPIVLYLFVYVSSK